KAKEIVSYLSDLGISHFYASPVFKARKKSLHGYDIVDPNRLNPELGSQEDFIALSKEIKGMGMYWLQDIVPNHMAIDSDNFMLMDVFENGRDSEYVELFDIDWNHMYENMRGRMLVPLLGSFYAEALERQEIRLGYNEKGFNVQYYNLALPLKVGSYITVLEIDIKSLEQRLAGNSTDFIKLLGIINLFKSLAFQDGDTAQSAQVRHAKAMLWELYQSNPEVRKYIDENIVLLNGNKDAPHSMDNLDALISAQFFRFSFWKVASEEINYRRFFTINELISIRVEKNEVFDKTHQLILDMVSQGYFDALRVDHIDGLYDPARYLERLREKIGDRYVVVEKILGPQEFLRRDWSAQGTTGYDFLNYVNGVLCVSAHAKKIQQVYQRFTDFSGEYEKFLAEKKRNIIGKHLAGNIDNLAHELKDVSGRDRYGRDITLYGLRRALVEVMAFFPIYRTYINQEIVGEEDTWIIKAAIEKAKENLSGFFYELDFIKKFLLLEFNHLTSEEDKKRWVNFVMNFQQYTGPLMAKGLEDTVFYIYNRLISLNEVGGFPDRFGLSLKDFHEFNQQRAQAFPHTLNATATHDTKRGEDARARIDVLSELPEEWAAQLRKWHNCNLRKKAKGKGYAMPDENDEYFIYQALIGSLPFEEPEYSSFVERMKEYIVKAVREAKRHTAWIKPDTAYEEASVEFVSSILKKSDDNLFLKDFIPFQKKIAYYGIFNSLTQAILKLTAPGIPDFYQGTELWDFSFVDPDNRRPVDFQKRSSILQNLIKEKRQDIMKLIRDLFSHKEDGELKLFLLYRLLRARKKYEVVFQNAAYQPLEAEGICKDNIIAYTLNYQNSRAIIVVPRFFCSLMKEGEFLFGEGTWKDTVVKIPGVASARYEDAITGQVCTLDETFSPSQIFAGFPGAVLFSTNQ
ncbi:MAG: malto-oligosyltrehalose synthase, partial [Candidatus Omnitrophica bacterium]|nr:malto-oligosyltrehalose synthase [Candidatus Omnitrophota bacterium]